jgi:para-nitrobenzyl esterase
MNFAGTVGLAITVLTLSGTAVGQPKEPPTEVNVDGGTVRGTSGKDVIAFKGIPFAQPPVGPLRWRAPQSVKAWEGVRDATVFGADPMQPIKEGDVTQPLATDAKHSEDCLYLNVYRTAAAGDKPLPVMVWIYGGGLVTGGSSMYPGEGLARQGIIVVTVNYRLGRFGFFAHPALANEASDDLRSNYGYMDQIAALKWVQKNIAAFGGDPKNVTIAGESAGGASVLVHLTSPLSRGLFHRAILESPGIPTPRAGAGRMHTLDKAESIAVEYAKANGIEGDDRAALDKLRALPAATLVKGTEDYLAAILGGPEIPGLAACCIEGRLVVEAPEVTLRTGKQALVPVLIGANDADIAAGPAHTKESLFARFGPFAPEARTLYDPKGDTSFAQVYRDVIADQIMVEPTRHFAEVMTKAGQPVYWYRFSYVPEDLRGKVPGALHAAEIIFAFDIVPLILKDKATKSDLAMAKTTSGYWVDFVKTGDPNGGGRPNWPKYDSATRDVLNFTNTGVTHGADPLKKRLDLWKAVWDGEP